MKTIEIGTRKIVVKGIGKLFYQEGFPIGMSATMLEKEGIEVSWLHIAKELLLEWEPKTVLNKLTGEIESLIEGDKKPDLQQIATFLKLDYEDQQEMIFQYLFGASSQSVMQNKEFRDTINPFTKN